jgi:peptide/nickel transport system permease protein
VLFYMVRRIGMGLITLFAVSVIVFFILRIIPGDAAVMLSGAGAGAVSEQELADVRAKMGLDKPMSVQFLNWADDVAHLRLGDSLRTGHPVVADIVQRFPYTFQLVLMAMVMAVVVGIPLGVISARFAGSWLDQALQTISVVGLAAPSFWVGLMIIVGLVWLFQWSAPLFWDSFWDNPADNLSEMGWPALAVGIHQIALIARMTRSVMLDALSADYIRTARSKGLTERRVVVRHALRNALMPVVTLIGLEFSALFGGLIVTETVFNVPGLGQYVVTAIVNRDYPAAQGIALTLAAIIVLGSLAVDLLYAWLDPRTRLQAN